MEILANRRLQNTIDRIEELPSLPNVVQRIILVADDPDSTAQQLKDIVLCDPVLSAKVLKTVNSAFYGFSGGVASLKQAIVILGFKTVKDIALGLSMTDYFRPFLRGANFDVERFWRHSIGVAALARRLAEKRAPELAEPLFVAGLLHDVGRLIMNYFYPKEFELALEIMEEDRSQLFEAEQAVFEIDHAEVAGKVLERWNFPASIHQTIRGHHQPNAHGEFFQHTAILHVADLAVKLMRINLEACNEFVSELQYNAEALAAVGVKHSALMNCRDQIAKAVSDGERILFL